jgi:uncharacterized protein YoxC
MDDGFFLAIIVAVIFLFVIWLIYRIDKLAAKKSIYKDFPFIKDAMDNFQHKIDYFTTRMDALEEKVNKLQNQIKL